MQTFGLRISCPDIVIRNCKFAIRVAIIVLTEAPQRSLFRNNRSNGTNGDNLYICIATVENTIQTVNFPMYDTHMSTPSNTAKLGTAHSNIQTAQSNPSLVGSEHAMH